MRRSPFFPGSSKPPVSPSPGRSCPVPEINKADPLDTARMVRKVLTIFRDLEGRVGVLPVSPRESQGSAGGTIRLTYNFSGGPTSLPLTVFVHFFDERGSLAFQDDHQPPRPSDLWSDKISYTRDVFIPPKAPTGLYRVRLGLYDAFGSHERLDLTPEQGAIAVDHRCYEVGMLRVG